jgi:N-acetylglutamate synthase-like GNAT family acetyltransferase
LHIGSHLLEAMEADGRATGVGLVHLLPVGDSAGFYQKHDYHFYGDSGLMIKEL